MYCRSVDHDPFIHKDKRPHKLVILLLDFQPPLCLKLVVYLALMESQETICSQIQGKIYFAITLALFYTDRCLYMHQDS
jgi:hypothetical protein